MIHFTSIALAILIIWRKQQLTKKSLLYFRYRCLCLCHHVAKILTFCNIAGIIEDFNFNHLKVVNYQKAIHLTNARKYQSFSTELFPFPDLQGFLLLKIMHLQLNPAWPLHLVSLFCCLSVLTSAFYCCG